MTLRPIDSLISQRDAVEEAMRHLDLEAFSEIVRMLREQRGATVWTAGNGGSAANASHLAAHLRECGFTAICVPESVALLTATSNDYRYEDSMWRAGGLSMLKNGDVVIALSCSGRSPNILALLKEARRVGMVRLGLFGFPETCLAKHDCHAALVVQSEDYGAIEDTHSMVIHALAKELKV